MSYTKGTLPLPLLYLQDEDPEPAGFTCVDVEDFDSGRLGNEQRNRFLDHLMGCSRCLRRLAVRDRDMQYHHLHVALQRARRPA